MDFNQGFTRNRGGTPPEKVEAATSPKCLTLEGRKASGQMTNGSSEGASNFSTCGCKSPKCFFLLLDRCFFCLVPLPPPPHQILFSVRRIKLQIKTIIEHPSLNFGLYNEAKNESNDILSSCHRAPPQSSANVSVVSLAPPWELWYSHHSRGCIMRHGTFKTLGVQDQTKWLVFRMIHVKDSLLATGKVWSLDFLGKCVLDGYETS